MEVDKQTMESMKFLAETNLKIGEAKNTFIKLQEIETEYLEAREKKALEKIQKILEESRDLLTETQSNYEQVHDLCITVSSFVDTLIEVHAKFRSMMSDFDNRTEAWEKEVANTHKELEETKKLIRLDRQLITNDRKSIMQKENIIRNDQVRIESQRSQIKSALDLINSKK